MRVGDIIYTGLWGAYRVLRLVEQDEGWEAQVVLQDQHDSSYLRLPLSEVLATFVDDDGIPVQPPVCAMLA